MTILQKIFRLLKQRLIGLELSEYKKIKHLITNKVGLEIGGPSNIFKPTNILPVYADVARIDGVNFSTYTVWEDVISKGLTYDYGGLTKGQQFIKEASALYDIADNEYDFILSSHSLEHCANVIKTLEEWKRVLRAGGLMIVVVPDSRYTFDQKRSTTEFSHLLDDYKRNVDETDLTHLEEILSFHDLTRDDGVKNHNEFKKRSLMNYENRCLHHHIFDINLLIKLFTHLDMAISYTGHEDPHHIIIMARKKL